MSQDEESYKVVKGKLTYDQLIRAISAKKVRGMTENKKGDLVPAKYHLRFDDKPRKNMAAIFDPALGLILRVFRTKTGRCFFEAIGSHDDGSLDDITYIIDAIEHHFKVKLDLTQYTPILAQDLEKSTTKKKARKK